MPKYERVKQRIIRELKEGEHDGLTTHEMLELATTRSGKQMKVLPSINQLCQSLRRDKRFVKLPRRGLMSRGTMGHTGEGLYSVIVWGLSDYAEEN